MSANTYQEVGQSMNLLPATLSRYVAYMLIRWAHRERELCSMSYSNYAQEWAERFKEGTEYQESDCEGIAVLRRIDGGEKSYLCLKTIKKKCPICELQFTLLKDSNADEELIDEQQG